MGDNEQETKDRHQFIGTNLVGSSETIRVSSFNNFISYSDSNIYKVHFLNLK